MAQSRTEAGQSRPVRAVLTAGRPKAAFNGRAICNDGDLFLDLSQSRASAGLPSAYVLTVTGEFGKDRRRLAAFTPYPTGSASSFRIPFRACSGVDRIEVDARPVHGGALPPGTEIEFVLRPGTKDQERKAPPD
jgi:hypothetical protein